MTVFCCLQSLISQFSPQNNRKRSSPINLHLVLFKNAEAIEAMREIDTLVVDKTGTLTVGRPKLTGVVSSAGIGEEELLRLAAGLERGSEHLLAAAIVEGALARNVPLTDAQGFIFHPTQHQTEPVLGLCL